MSFSSIPRGSDRKTFPAHWIVYAVSFAASYPVPAVMPVLPLIKAHLAITDSAAALINFAFALPCMFMTPVYGILADRVPVKKLLVPCVFFFTLGTFCCGLADSLAELLFWRLVQGMGGASLSLFNTSLMGDLFSGPERGKYMARSFAVMSVGVLIFPILSGKIAEVAGWRYAFFIPAFSNLPLLVATLLMHSTPKPPMPSLRTYLVQALGIVKSTQALYVFAISFCNVFVTMGTIMTFYPLYADLRFHAAAGDIGLIYAMGMCGMPAGSLIASWNRKLTIGQLVGGIALLAALCMLAMSFLPSLWMLFFPLFVCAMNDGITQPSLSYVMSNLGEGTARTAAIAASNTFMRMSQAVGPVIGGLILVCGGSYRIIFVVSGSFLVLQCFLALTHLTDGRGGACS